VLPSSAFTIRKGLAFLDNRVFRFHRCDGPEPIAGMSDINSFDIPTTALFGGGGFPLST